MDQKDASQTQLNRVLSQKILRARARKLARPIFAEAQKELAYRVIMVNLGGGRFAFETEYVEEVVRLKEVIPLPGLSAPFVGLTNVRGELVVVMEPGQLLAPGQSTHSNSSVEKRLAVVLVHKGRRLALLVEDLLGSRDIDSAELAREFSGLSNQLSLLTRAVTRELLIILDVAKIFEEVRGAAGG